MPPINGPIVRNSGDRRDNVELTADCGGLLDACAGHPDAQHGGGLVVGRSHISELGIQAFRRVGNDDGPIIPAFAAVTALIAQNYRLIHADGKESGYAVVYSADHHDGIERLGQRYLLGRKTIYLRRATIALGLAEQNYLNLLHVNINGNLQRFLLQLKGML